MVLDRLFLFIFTTTCVCGTMGIFLNAPSLYDPREALTRANFNCTKRWMQHRVCQVFTLLGTFVKHYRINMCSIYERFCVRVYSLSATYRPFYLCINALFSYFCRVMVRVKCWKKSPFQMHSKAKTIHFSGMPVVNVLQVLL